MIIGLIYKLIYLKIVSNEWCHFIGYQVDLFLLVFFKIFIIIINEIDGVWRSFGIYVVLNFCLISCPCFDVPEADVSFAAVMIFEAQAFVLDRELVIVVAWRPRWCWSFRSYLLLCHMCLYIYLPKSVQYLNRIFAEFVKTVLVIFDICRFIKVIKVKVTLSRLRGT